MALTGLPDGQKDRRASTRQGDVGENCLLHFAADTQAETLIIASQDGASEDEEIGVDSLNLSHLIPLVIAVRERERWVLKWRCASGEERQNDSGDDGGREEEKAVG